MEGRGVATSPAVCDDLRVGPVPRVVVATLLLCGGVAACGSQDAPSTRLHQPTTATPSQTSAAAPTAITAAVGFDQSIRTSGAKLAFACLPLGYPVAYRAGATGTPTTTITRSGSRWIVTLRYPADTARYEVGHEKSGYCVTRILSPRPLSGSPLTYTPGSPPLDMP